MNIQVLNKISEILLPIILQNTEKTPIQLFNIFTNKTNNQYIDKDEITKWVFWYISQIRKGD